MSKKSVVGAIIDKIMPIDEEIETVNKSEGVTEIPPVVEEKKEEPIVNRHFAVNESHYGGRIQPLEFMQAQMNDIEFIGFLKGNVIKYVSRAGKKSLVSPLEDLHKAKRYLDWLIQAYNREIINPREE